MRLAFRPPLLVLAVGLLALLLLLATLQYVWLGRISEAERERLQATLAARSVEFAQDFDRELARAYLLFQTEGPERATGASARFAERYDRWQATSSYPRLLKDFYIVGRGSAGGFELQRFDATSRTLRPAEWPESMADWRTRLDDRAERRPDGAALVIRRLPAPVWETVPALIVPTPILFVSERPGLTAFSPPEFSYTVLAIDLDYVKKELLPSLAQRHFRKAGDASEYDVAVIDRAGDGSVVYQSTTASTPRTADSGDASAPLFQLRTQDFSAVAAEVRRFAMFSTTTTRVEHQAETRDRRDGGMAVRAPTQMSILVQQGPGDGLGRGAGPSVSRIAAPTPRWQVIVKHPAGSLEAFVGATRRRNLIVSSTILAVLGASMGLLIVSTRRSQQLARQQLEFVAAVSHELRTPLAVIRSAGDNLADGVVHDEAQVRRYGELIRFEGRRLSAMVEQILEFAGIQSGQRGFVRQAVPVGPLIGQVLSASRALVDEAGIQVELDVPQDLPPVAGDEAALRRVFQNLVGNAIKYGASGGWIGIRARLAGPYVTVAVSDKGIGIPPAEQGRIFEPFYRAADVVAAQFQGAGLGLSLVQRILDAHGGRIVVRSAPGAGSEFTVSLPVAAGGAAEPISAAQPGAEAASSS